MQTKTKNKKNRKLVIIPTYNERQNIEELIEEILIVVPDINILVIDDNSPDGTADIVRDLADDDERIKLVKRRKKLGLGTAYRLGFEYALHHNYEYIIEMDADFSHDPVILEKFLGHVDEYDLVIGSRYVKGGRMVNWPIARWLLSFGANMYVRLITGMPINDATAGFKCFRRRVIKSIDLTNVMSDGYAFQIEMHYKAWRNHWKLKEIPITFVDRSNGQSKLDKKVIWEAIWMPWKLKLAPVYEYWRDEVYMG